MGGGRAARRISREHSHRDRSEARIARSVASRSIVDAVSALLDEWPREVWVPPERYLKYFVGGISASSCNSFVSSEVFGHSSICLFPPSLIPSSVRKRRSGSENLVSTGVKYRKRADPLTSRELHRAVPVPRFEENDDNVGGGAV